MPKRLVQFGLGLVLPLVALWWAAWARWGGLAGEDSSLNPAIISYLGRHFPRGVDNGTVSVIGEGSELAKLGYNLTSVLQVKELLIVPSESFQVVVAVGVLDRVSNLTAAATEIHRVLKPGGIFAFDCFNRNLWNFLWYGLVPRSALNWTQFVTPTQLKQLLISEGFLTDPITWRGTGHSLGGLFHTDPADLSGKYLGYAVKDT